MPAWYESFFDDRYLEFHEGLVSLAPSDREAEFIDRALCLEPGSRILDLGCGFGRHSVALARLGHRVTGLDLSPTLLAHAARVAEAASVAVTWVRRDMRDLAGLGPFDAVVCLYTVLGYFDDAGNEQVVRAARDALRPDGRLVLDIQNPLSRLVGWRRVEPAWRELPRTITREISHYDAPSGRLFTERSIFRKEGGRVDLPESVVRMYAPSETARMLRDAGLEVEQLHGALGDEPFAWDRSEKQVWVARRG